MVGCAVEFSAKLCVLERSKANKSGNGYACEERYYFGYYYVEPATISCVDVGYSGFVFIRELAYAVDTVVRIGAEDEGASFREGVGFTD